MSLKDPTLKMSKSHDDPRSRILLSDSPDEISKKVKLALTDSENRVSYEPLRRPGVSNLIEIASHLDSNGNSCCDLAREFETSSVRGFKENVATKISESLAAIRSKYLSLIDVDANDILRNIALDGATRAQDHAKQTLLLVREA
ncbi:mitochondrial 37S ribosomal protein rsm10, partial [Loxospora ochrophaea]|nr:mitochondrial 37S ribosomal protein rsm10 [Loxospora ochrophaea]